MFDLASLRTACRLAARQLRADPGTTWVAVAGLALAIAGAYLVAAFVIDQVLPDPRVGDPDRLLSLEFKGNIPGRHDDWFPNAPFAFGSRLQAAGAPVTAVGRTLGGFTGVRAGERRDSVEFLLAEPAVASMFGWRALRGDLSAALARPDAAALTPAAAARLFGDADPIGRQFRTPESAFTVVAIVSPPSVRSPLQYEAIGRFDSPANPASREERENHWYVMAGNVWATLAPGHAAEEVGEAAQRLFDTGPAQQEIPKAWTEGGRHGAYLRAVPLSRKALEGAGGEARRTALAGVAAAAALLVALALANYVNLTTVRTLRRQREIAVRKALGAGAGRLVAQFVVESTLVAALGVAAGLGIAWLAAPAVSALADVPLERELLDAPRVACGVLAALLLGALTGLYPARVALGVRCAQALAGRDAQEGAGGRAVRRALTALQFAVAMALSGATAVLLWQNHHVATADPGFERADRLAAFPPGDASSAAVRAFRAGVAASPGVRGVAWSGDVPGTHPIGMLEAFRGNGRVLSMRVDGVEPSFFDVYRVRLVAGAVRAPVAGGEMLAVIDTEAVRAFGFPGAEAAVGQLLTGGGDFLQAGNLRMRVVAVAAPVRQEGVHAPPQPQAFQLLTEPGPVLTVHADDVATARRAVDAAWAAAFPEFPPATDTVEASIARQQAFDQRVTTLVALAGGLALLLAAFGIYALSAYTVRRSAREIVLRKLHGAGPGRVARLLWRELGPVAGLGALVGVPAAVLLGERYLSTFVDRAPHAAWALPLGAAALAVVSAGAAWRHARVAMRLSPLDALRD